MIVKNTPNKEREMYIIVLVKNLLTLKITKIIKALIKN